MGLAKKTPNYEQGEPQCNYTVKHADGAKPQDFHRKTSQSGLGIASTTIVLQMGIDDDSNPVHTGIAEGGG